MGTEAVTPNILEPLSRDFTSSHDKGMKKKPTTNQKQTAINSKLHKLTNTHSDNEDHSTIAVPGTAKSYKQHVGYELTP
jgi:hypothetical protein